MALVFVLTFLVSFKYLQAHSSITLAILDLCFNSPTPSLQSVSMSAFWLRPPTPAQKCADIILKAPYWSISIIIILSSLLNRSLPCDQVEEAKSFWLRDVGKYFDPPL